MPNFLENILAQLNRADGRVVLREIRGDRFVSVTGRELLDQVQLVRTFIRNAGVQPGDRCALLAPNSIRWAAFHLALMAEAAIVVPLYSRQSPAELATMMKDCQPRLIFVSDTALGGGVAEAWPEAPRCALFEEVLYESTSQPRLPDAHRPGLRAPRARRPGPAPRHRRRPRLPPDHHPSPARQRRRHLGPLRNAPMT